MVRGNALRRRMRSGYTSLNGARDWHLARLCGDMVDLTTRRWGARRRSLDRGSMSALRDRLLVSAVW